MGIPTLIKTLTADGDDTLSFVDGTASVVFDNTYDEYMFVFTDINPDNDEENFSFQVNAAGASGYNETITSTFFNALHTEADSTSLGYRTSADQAQGTAFQPLNEPDQLGNGSDESLSGILHVFSPASTTYVTNFYATTNHYMYNSASSNNFIAGYVNATAAVDEIQFKMASGNFDGVIQMYGIA